MKTEDYDIEDIRAAIKWSEECVKSTPRDGDFDDVDLKNTDGEDQEFINLAEGPYFLHYPNGAITFFPTEEAAAKEQRAYRIRHKRDPITGEEPESFIYHTGHIELNLSNLFCKRLHIIARRLEYVKRGTIFGTGSWGASGFIHCTLDEFVELYELAIEEASNE